MENNILFTILVPTVPNRINYFYPKIMNELIKQTEKYDNIELIAFFDNKKRTIGKKRDEMLKLAQGIYVTFIDDDDRISDKYIDEIMKAINTNKDVDCIVFNTETKIESTQKVVLCKYGIDFNDAGYINLEKTEWRGKPSHTMIWKSTIAKSHIFPDKQNGEDMIWVNKAYPDIKTQHRIDKILYYYDACYTTTSETANLSDSEILDNVNKLIDKSNNKNKYIFEHWENCHNKNEREHHFYLTGSSLEQYTTLFNCSNHYQTSNTILEIGIGEGKAIREMYNHGKQVTATDISKFSKKKIEDVAIFYHLDDINNISSNSFDIIFCHLVVQHIDNNMLEYHLKHFIPTLKNDGIYYIQYRGEHTNIIDKDVRELCKHGDVVRKPEFFKNIVEKNGGIVIEDNIVRSGEYIESVYKPWSWRVIKIMKNNEK